MKKKMTSRLLLINEISCPHNKGTVRYRKYGEERSNELSGVCCRICRADYDPYKEKFDNMLIRVEVEVVEGADGNLRLKC